VTLQQQDRPQPPTRIDLYEVEMEIFFHEDKKLLTRLQKYGELKEEKYIWGRDDKNRPRREKMVLTLVLPRSEVADFKMRITKLDQALRSKLQYRKVSTLI